MDINMRNEIFVSYSHKDKVWLNKLQIMLQPLVREKKLTLWDDTKIRPGTDWRQEIKDRLAVAKVAVLLVSSDFLASEFIAEHELPPLLEAATKEGLVILWVALRPSMYKETEIERYQAVNDPAKPLSSLKGASREAALFKICEQIRDAANYQTSKARPVRHDQGQTNAASTKQVQIEQPDRPNLADLVINQTNQYVSIKKKFSAWEVTLALRAAHRDIYIDHGVVRDIVHAHMQTLINDGRYQRTTGRSGQASYKLYVPTK